eukprot:scaffold53580_cov65-Phaeocystis_antarctica.AAC.9
MQRVVVANTVGQLEVGAADPPLGVHFVEPLGQGRGDVADGDEVRAGDVLVVDRVLEGATRQLHHNQELPWLGPRRWPSLGIAVVGGGSNGGGGRAVEERAVVNFEAAEQEEGRLHRLLARRVGDVDGAATVGVGEPGERGSGLDGLAEPGSVDGVGEDGPEEGGHRQRIREQEGVQLARGAPARLDDQQACVSRDDSWCWLSILGAWGEGQL